MTRRTLSYLFSDRKVLVRRFNVVVSFQVFLSFSKQETLSFESLHHNRASLTTFCWGQSNREIESPNCSGLCRRSCLRGRNLSEVKPETTTGRRLSTSPSRCREIQTGECDEILTRNGDCFSAICRPSDLSATRCLRLWCCWDCTGCRRGCCFPCPKCRLLPKRTSNDASNVGQFAKSKMTKLRWQEVDCRWRKRWASSLFQLSFRWKNEEG